jgi:hypothetical protein
MDRRQFIMTSLGTGLALTLGISAYPLLTASGSEQRSAAELVFSAFLPALLHGALPSDERQAQQQLANTQKAALEFLPFLPRSQQQQLHDLFILLQQQLTRLALTGRWLSLHELPINDRIQLLNAWRDSYLGLLQQAYHGLRELLFGAYYGQPAHWQPLRYQAVEFNRYE